MESEITMTTIQLRRQIKRTIDQLPEADLRTAADFVRYLREKDSAPDEADVATLKKRLEKAEEDFARGRSTPVQKLRRKY